VRRISTIAMVLFAALFALALAGCGTTQSGTAVAGSSIAVQSTKAPATVTTTAPAPRPKPKPAQTPTPTVTATVLVQPPVTVVQPQAPVTVYRVPAPAPAPVYTSTADDQVASDYSAAESVVGWWIPQLSSNPDSASAMAKFSALQSMGYSDVFMVSSNDYTSFRYSGYYVTMIPRTFSTASGANAWCDSEGFATDNCFAKRLSHNDGPDGNSVERG
jgi:hypothetical protein